LAKAKELIDKQLKFAFDDRIGYIASCPSNLGTSLRASVHIHLPYLGERKEELQEIVD
jgi:protein-arginine kinase